MEEAVLKMFDITHLLNTSMLVYSDRIDIEGELEGPDCCPCCEGHRIHRKARNQRVLHLPPVGHKRAQLRVHVQKRACATCNYHWWPSLPFSQGKERMTHAFVQYAIGLLRFGTIQDVARHLGIAWDIVKGMHRKYLEEMYEEIDLSDVEYISIDEFAIAKGHKYMTLVVDIAKGRVIHAVEGRKKEVITPLLKELKKKHPHFKLLV